ncbi:MAG: TolC family protein [Blastocatellia bacterium]
MSSLIQKLQQSGRVVTSLSLAALLASALPIGVFAQNGVVARQQQPTQQQPQQPKPPETPPSSPTTPPRNDTREQRERLEEHGTTNPNLPTERERRNVPAPGQAPVTNPAVTPTPGAPAQDTTGQNPITQPIAASPEVGHERIGVDLSQTVPLAMRDAIALALQNNLDIEQFREGVQIATFNLQALRGVYDILSSADVNFRSQTIPVASLFAGGGSAFSVTQKTLTANFITNQYVERSGGFWQAEFDNNRTTTSSTAQLLPTQYNPTLTFSFTQPLMRNFKTDLNRRQIQVAKKTVDLTDSQFRQRVIEIINQVQRAYWDLVFAIDNEKIARDTVELTRTQLENNRRQVEAGTAAPIDLRSTEAALEQRKGDVITALQNITTAENVLKGLLIKRQDDKLWTAVISPTDAPPVTAQNFNLDEATRLALTNRPELEQVRLQTEQKNIDIDFYKNQTKPQIDLVGFYSNTGLAGTPSSAVNPGGFSTFNQGVITNLNAALSELDLPLFNPVVPAATVVGDSVPSRFQGGYFQSLHNLFSQDFRTYQVGVRLSFPWRNRTAEGNLGRALAESRQLDARQRQLVQSVQIDVRNALQAVEAARQRYEAAHAGELAAYAQLQGEQEKFRAGLSTNFFVLQRQTDYATALGNEVRAKTDYNKALADLQRVTGLTLVSNNVQVTALAPPTGKK